MIAIFRVTFLTKSHTYMKLNFIVFIALSRWLLMNFQSFNLPHTSYFAGFEQLISEGIISDDW